MRKNITPEQVDEALRLTGEMLKRRLVQKGTLSYASTHEGLGIITEEFHELVDAVKSNDKDAFEKECLDVAVGCIFSIASLRAGALDW